MYSANGLQNNLLIFRCHLLDSPVEHFNVRYHVQKSTGMSFPMASGRCTRGI
jgi:hypothetical protein